MRILQPGETCYFIWEVDNKEGHTWRGGIVQSYDEKNKRYTIALPEIWFVTDCGLTIRTTKIECYFVRSHKPKKGIILPA